MVHFTNEYREGKNNRKMKSGELHRFSLNKQLKITLRTLLFMKNQSTQKVQIRFAKSNQTTASNPS